MAKAERLYAIYGPNGERVTTGTHASVLDAWHALSWKYIQGVDEVRAKYEPMGYTCWEVEITKKLKVRTRKGKGNATTETP